MITAVGVVVPACDEQELITACLDALDRAGRYLLARRPDIRLHTVVVLDRCTDATASLVTTRPGVRAVPVGFGRVGGARRAGAADLLAQVSDPPERVWIANTDADSQVPAPWLHHLVEQADAGADLVLGSVYPGPGLPRQVERSWHARHPARAQHPYVHGANLGIRADAYLRLGGWPDLATGEDVLLAATARSTPGLTVVSSPCWPVRTSSRRSGRAPSGFSSYLRRLAVDAPLAGPASTTGRPVVVTGRSVGT